MLASGCLIASRYRSSVVAASWRNVRGTRNRPVHLAAMLLGCNRGTRTALQHRKSSAPTGSEARTPSGVQPEVGLSVTLSGDGIRLVPDDLSSAALPAIGLEVLEHTRRA